MVTLLFEEPGKTGRSAGLQKLAGKRAPPPAHIGRRWRIDTEVFQTLTTQAHLKQPSVHRPRALMVLTMIRVLAYTLSLVFYHRQVVCYARRTAPSFGETARLLAYPFLLARLDSS